MKIDKKATRTARELYRACLVAGDLDAGRARRVARRIGESTRHGALPVLEAFQRLVRLDVERRTARVESAVSLTDALRTRIEGGLARDYGPHIHTSFGENPSLIAGIRIKVGSDVYDGSVRARLDALEARL